MEVSTVAEAIGIYAPGFGKALGLGLFLPMLSDNFVRMPWRVMFALWFSILCAPLTDISSVSAPALAFLMAFVEGSFVGILGRLVVTAAQIAGNLIASQIGLQQAQMLNPAESQQGTAVELLFYFIALKVLISSGFFAMALAYSAPVGLLSISTLADALQVMESLIQQTFLIAIALATPFLIFNLLFSIGLSVSSRFLPAFPLFFVLSPIQILLGLFLLSEFVSLGPIRRALSALILRLPIPSL